MIPRAFVTLNSLPLTQTGKLDRRALPTPEQDPGGRGEYLGPQGEVEEALAEIWQSLLHVARIGRHDNFFELGGHSLLATRLTTQIERLFDVEIPLRVLFERPTIGSLGEFILEAIAAEVVMEE